MFDRWIARLRKPVTRRGSDGDAPSQEPPSVSDVTGSIALLATQVSLAARLAEALEASHPRCDVLAVLTPDDWLGLAASSNPLDVVVVVPEADAPQQALMWSALRPLRPRPWVVVVEAEGVTAQPPAGQTIEGRVALGPGWSKALGTAVAAALNFVGRRRDEAGHDLLAALEDASTDPEPLPLVAARPLIELLRDRVLTRVDEARCAEALAARLDHLPSVTRVEALSALAQRAADLHDELGFTWHLARLDELTEGTASASSPWTSLRTSLAPALHAAIDRELEQARLQRRIGRHDAVLAICDTLDTRLANLIPVGLLRAEALRHLGDLPAAIGAYEWTADRLLSLGEAVAARRLLGVARSLDPDGTAEARLAARLEAIERADEALARGLGSPRYPALAVCRRALCQEAAEASGAFIQPAVEVACDICDTGVLGQVQAITGRTLAVIGGGLGRFYRDALRGLGAREVFHHACHDDPEAVAGQIEAADAVVLVSGAALHAGVLRAERVLLSTPRPVARVHYGGVRQVVRAVALDLAPQLTSEGETARPW